MFRKVHRATERLVHEEEVNGWLIGAQCAYLIGVNR